jgi:hypothetical protein
MSEILAVRFKGQRKQFSNRTVFTLASDDFNPHAGMTVPANCMESDVASRYWFIKVGMFGTVRIRITVENLE